MDRIVAAYKVAKALLLFINRIKQKWIINSADSPYRVKGAAFPTQVDEV